MTDADTPRVPDLWWSAKDNALWCNSPYNEGFYVGTKLAEDYYSAKLPADAVGPLGNVSDLDRLRRDLTATLGLLETERETLEAAESEMADLRQHARNVAAQRDAELAAHKRVAAELDALREDIRGLLDQLDAQRDNPQIRSRMQDGSNAPLHRAFEAGVRYAVGCLRRILDREPGREEPRGRCSRCGQQVPRSQQADHAREHHASCACEECMPIGMDDA